MIKNYKQALDYMFEFESSKDDSLKTIEQALELFWNPLNDCKIIHIAGTNGKGSVSKMLFSILKQSWKKVWVFTSPHLIDIQERFESDAWIISQDNFIKYVSQISKQDIKLAYFEKCFLISLLYFRDEKCEYAIVETWVWGTFDTTNIVSPVLTCITSISYDHQWLLWDTLEKISAHKAGIIKPSIPLVINFHNAVIETRAMKLWASIIFTNKKRNTNLLWEYQKSNAWLAWELALQLGIDSEHVSIWLQNVDHKWRLQKIWNNILVDWAHNEEWVKQLLMYIKNQEIHHFDKAYYCFNVKKWKNPEIVRRWIGEENNCILLNVSSEFVSDSENFRDDFIIKNKKQIYVLAKDNPKNLYVIFWSLYMIWEFL